MPRRSPRPEFQGSPRIAERYAPMIPNIGLKNDRTNCQHRVIIDMG